jgi:hypothetical protein
VNHPKVQWRHLSTFSDRMTKSRALLLSRIPAMRCCRQKRWRAFKNLRRRRARSDARSVRDASSVGPQSEQFGYAEMLGLGARSMVVGVEGPASPPLPQHAKIGELDFAPHELPESALVWAELE